jgi:hypothetical protein
MPPMEFKCPERGCKQMTTVWVPNFPQHQSEHDADAACPKHKAKYESIRQKHVKECEQLGIRA